MMSEIHTIMINMQQAIAHLVCHGILAFQWDKKCDSLLDPHDNPDIKEGGAASLVVHKYFKLRQKKCLNL